MSVERDDIARAVEQNAQRLLRDAEFLFDGGRYPSSAALSVLAIEEVGKWLFLRQSATPDSVRLRHHVQKQISASTMCLADEVWEAIQTRLSEHGLEMKHESKISDWQRAIMQNPNYSSWREASYQRTGLREAIVDVLQASSSSALLKDVRSGRLQQIKNQSLYADVESDAATARIWQSIGETDAAALISHARNAVKQIAILLAADKAA